MTTEIELQKLAEKHGYKLVSVKRFKKHDRTTFQTPENCKLTLTWCGHIEDFDIKYDEERGFFEKNPKHRRDGTALPEPTKKCPICGSPIGTFGVTTGYIFHADGSEELGVKFCSEKMPQQILHGIRQPSVREQASPRDEIKAEGDGNCWNNVYP